MLKALRIMPKDIMILQECMRKDSSCWIDKGIWTENISYAFYYKKYQQHKCKQNTNSEIKAQTYVHA